MNKQKIEDWVVESTGYFYDDNRITMNETIDIIQKYTQEQSGWVSVDDRLPEEYGEYLCATKARPHGWVFKYAQVGWMCSDEYPVTHWMPLPLPPTEEKV